jgi:succinoglycan biosynthesis transport protein ExoP
MDLIATKKRIHSAAAEERVDVLGLVEHLWRRKFTVLLFTLLMLIPVGTVIYSLKPEYQAEAQVLVDDHRTQLIAFPEVRTSLASSDDVVVSEVQVLLSRDLARQVIDELHLENSPEFNPTLHPQPRISSALQPLTAWLRNLEPIAWLLPQPRRSSTEATDEVRIVDTFLSRLSVLPTGRSRVIRVIFSSSSPATAAAVANAIVSQYLANQVEVKVSAAEKATKWIEDHLADLRANAERARMVKEKFRRQAGLTPNGQNTTLDTQEAADLTTQLAAAVARRSETEARLAAAHESGGIGGLAALSTSPVIHALRQQESTLRQHLADLQAAYGSGYPAVRQAQSQLLALEGSIARENGLFIDGLKAEYQSALRDVFRLTFELNNLKEAVGNGNKSDVTLAMLDRDVVSADQVYQLFLDRAKQTELEQTSQQPDSEIISHAEAPGAPFFPRKDLLLSLAALTSFLASCCVAMILDHRGQTFMAIEQAQSGLGADVLGFIPMMRRFALPKDAMGPGQAVLPRNMKNGWAAFSIAMQNIHVRLLASGGPPPRTIMFTSAQPNEGKSSAALGFATLMARTGRRVALLDFDTHNPQLHRAFGLPRSPGLTDYLADRSLEQVVKQTGPSGIHLVPAGTEIPHPAGMLGSERMAPLLVEMSKSYDLVVIDAPPVLTVPDALLLGPLVDRTVFLVQWAKTPHAAAERALWLLREAGTRVSGTVLSMVDVDKMAAHDPVARGYLRSYA